MTVYALSLTNTATALSFKVDGFAVTTIDNATFNRMKGKTYKNDMATTPFELRHKVVK